MTHFEFLSVAVSIVLALSAGQLVGNIREVFDPTRRYWVHALWVVALLLLHILNWWVLWGLRDVQAWNLAMFASVLIAPGLLFACYLSALLVVELGLCGWYADLPDLASTINLRNGENTLNFLGVRVGKVTKMGKQPVNVFVQPWYTPVAEGTAGQCNIKLNLTFMFPTGYSGLIRLFANWAHSGARGLRAE